MNLRLQLVALAVLPLVIAILSITALHTWQSASLAKSSIATFEANSLAAKKDEIVNLTSLAMSAIQGANGEAGSEDAEAKRRVIEIIRGLDYGEDGYFFVYDYDGMGVVHPRQDFRPGRNWLDLTDPDGTKVIARLIETARVGGGYFRYKWERPSTGEVVDKISYVVDLPKWRWILGTGVYLDEVQAQTSAARAELRRSIGWTFLVVTLVAVPAILVVFAACMLVTLRERRLADGKLKELAQRVIDAQEEERARLARELHDGISQSLVGVRYALDLASRKARAGDGDPTRAIEHGVETLNGTIKEVRRLSHGLRPRLLDDLGLVAALRPLCESFAERTGIDTSLDAAAFVDTLKPEARTALYRIVQEALTNVERHAGATHVALRLWNEGGRARLRIADDGRGFVVDGEAAGGGLGLRNMQERMAHFRGVLLIRSGQGGTVLTAMLPRSANRQAEPSAA